MKHIKCLGHIIFFIFIIFTIIMNFYLYITRSVLENRKASFLGVGSAIIISGSMEPTIHINDMVITMQAGYDVGDIIMFDDGHALVTHRIIQIKNGQYVTQGDHNNTQDSKLVHENDIVGKVIFIIPKVGQFIMYMQTPMVMMLMVVSLFLILYYPLILRKK